MHCRASLLHCRGFYSRVILLDMNNRTILASALIGLEFQKSKIESMIAEVRAELDGVEIAQADRDAAQRRRGPGRKKAATTQSTPAEPAAPKKRTMSASARKRIAAAQKKRWADHHAAQKAEK
jgi:hypothetical protein